MRIFGSLLLICSVIFTVDAADAIRQQIEASSLSSALWSFYVEDQETHEPIYQWNASQLCVPASTTKLFTAVTALQTLGEDFLYRTSARIQGEVVEEAIKGDLILVGSGDPTLTKEALADLAQKIYQQGVRVIEGQVKVDTTAFTGAPVPAHWEVGDLTWYFAPELSALSIDGNAVQLTIDKEGHLKLDEAVPYFQINNQMAVGSGPLDIIRGLLDNQLTITGWPTEELTKERIAIHQPEEYARQIFIDSLQKQGIVILDKELPDSGAISEYAYVESAPLSVIVKQMNKHSNNLIAEMLLRTYGKGSEKEGLAVEKRVLQAIGITPKQYQINDGSGLSRHNLLSAKAEVALLRYALQMPWKESFIQSLPIGGVDGSLASHFTKLEEGSSLCAKPGSMAHVLSIAGYATTKNGRKIIFAGHVNNYEGDRKTCMQFLDHLITTEILGK
jgi:D-alanyl-D-alanine carboxypeptidase/D-alanyl-D-alanine-endopeptidase (penicillin-binding protein 4)